MPQDVELAIQRFLKASHTPVLSEAGEELIPIGSGNFLIETQNGSLLLQAWSERKNLVRRVTGIESETTSKLVLRVERFGKRTGTLALIDLRKSAAGSVELRSTRLEFRETFRRFIRRELPGYKLAELSTEANLEESLSPSYARALLRQGAAGWAAIGVSADYQAIDGILSFGLRKQR